ncbi:MAG: hypothetical protein HQL60_05235 [Magnetococcales bacterium]|nr:hypothetical protein [Magnetococcales bacterium]
MMTTQIELVESTAGQVTAELMRRGIPPEQRIMVTIDREKELIPGRLDSRVRVIATGLTTDDDTDKLIDAACEEVQQYLQ